ncbi:MAG: sulfotransferase domain-containing protein [Anaerolineales bacterium]
MKDFIPYFSEYHKRPDFIIVGAMKSGTTQLYNFITLHPDIEEAKSKEIHYFTLYYHKGEEWYLEHFPSDPNKLTGEASPTYFHLADTTTIPSLIKRINNKIKIILIVRDPIERAVSHYNHFCKVNKIQEIMSLTVNEFFSIPYDEILTRSTNLGLRANQALSFSLYYRNYLRYNAMFDQNDMLVVSSQNLRDFPFETMKEVYHFTGVDYVEKEEFKTVGYTHGTDITKLDQHIFTRLAELFYPDYKKFCEITGLKYTELDPSSIDLTSDSSVEISSTKTHE